MATSSIVRLVQAFTQYLSLFRQTFLLCVCEQAVRGLLYPYRKLDIGKRQHSISISPVVFSNREFLLADSHIQLYDWNIGAWIYIRGSLHAFLHHVSVLWVHHDYQRVRYGFAVCQYIYALHLVFNKKSWLPALFFALFATQIHVSFAFFIPISVLLYWLCSTKRKTIVFFGLLSVVLIPIISHFSYLLGRRADWYFGGGNSVSDNSAITIYGFILTIGVRLFLLPLLVLVYQYFNPTRVAQYHSCRWTRMAAVWIGMAVMFISNMTMLYRLTFVLSTIGIFLLLEIEQHSYVRKRFITILLWCGIMTTLCNTVNYRSIILNSRYQYIAMPVPVILQDHYDKQWILEHVNGNKMKQ